MNQQRRISGTSITVVLGLLILSVLWLTSAWNYLLFHSLAEIFSVTVAFGVFVVFWNSRQVLGDGYYLFLGIAYLFVGGIDLLHILGYTGMGVFPGYGTNLPTQLWITARYAESISLLVAPLFIDRRPRPTSVFIGYAMMFALALGAIFYWDVFPDCFVEGSGLTPFKKTSEYVISLILLISVALLFRKRSRFDRSTFRLLSASIIVTIASEMSFTMYAHAYGLPNMVGHLLKIVSFFLIYKVFIEKGLKQPYQLLFRNLKQSEEALRHERDFAESLIETAQVIILVLDVEGRIVRFNPRLEDISGYRLEHMKGKDWLTTFVPQRERERVSEPPPNGMGTVRMLGPGNTIRTKDGTEREIEWHDKPLRDADGSIVGLLATGQDITERKRTEEQIEASLREKEVLLQEIHHRVKNNLQVICSLLDLQAESVRDSQALRTLKDSQNRVRSMALVHERLYRSQNLERIDIAEYTHELVNHLHDAYASQRSTITPVVEADDISLGIDEAIPCGLIINELVSNALRHAFPVGGKGEVRVAIRAVRNDRVTLTVSDNGVGFSPEVDIEKLPSLGLQLVNMLVRQLGGAVEMDTGAGTTVRITFATPQHEREVAR